MYTVLRSRMVKLKKPPTRRRCLCLCACGNKFFTWASSLKSGNTSSCGCVRNTRTKTKATKYKEPYSSRKHPLNGLYTRWSSMIDRCTSPTSANWKNYGGRGITVCDRWLHFDAFLEDMGTPPKGCTLERKNNDSGYSPENCRWATPKEQRANQRQRPPNKRVIAAAAIAAKKAEEFQTWLAAFEKKYG